MVYIGISNRTDELAVKFIESRFPVKKLYIGKDIMLLDVRMTILPKKHILIYPDSFTKEDLEYLRRKFKFIEVTKDEVKDLATNVFVINPHTIVLEKKQKRIQNKLRKKGFKLEVIDYSQPILIEGSFRCSTLPIEREY